MRHVVRHLILFALLGWTSACAETSACPTGQVLVEGRCVDDGPSKSISIACRNSVNDVTSVLTWELTVEPGTIEGGETFFPTLNGVAVFHEEFLDDALDELAVDEINLVELNATVQVRSGATGDPVKLTNREYSYECFLSPRESCDPRNDDPSCEVPGRCSNSDCQPESPQNPCGRFIRLPISNDCARDGLCATLGERKMQHCDMWGFCAIGDLEIPLKKQSGGEYIADPEGKVLFGWAEGAPIDQMPLATDPPGPLSLRLGIDGFPVAIECAMPLDTPDGLLVSFPIQTP